MSDEQRVLSGLGTFPSKKDFSKGSKQQQKRNKAIGSKGRNRNVGAPKFQQKKMNSGRYFSVDDSSSAKSAQKSKKKMSFKHNKEEESGTIVKRRNPEMKSSKRKKKGKNTQTPQEVETARRDPEYRNLGNDSEDDSIPDVSDMLEPDSDPDTVPMLTAGFSHPDGNVGWHENDEDEKEENDDGTGEDVDSEEASDTEDLVLTKQFREEMANLPLRQVRAMRDKLGLKLFNKAYLGETEDEKRKSDRRKQNIEEDSTNPQENKRGQHRPKEISSRKRVGVIRNNYGSESSSAKKKRDPRFDSRVGEFNEHRFDANYDFLDEIKANEKKELQEEMGACFEQGDIQRAATIKETLRRLSNQERSKKDKQLKMETMRDIRQENMERMLRGEAPKFKTKAEVRMLEMQKKFGQLKSENRLDKFLDKKAKRDAQKAKKLGKGIGGGEGDVVRDFEQKYGYQT